MFDLLSPVTADKLVRTRQIEVSGQELVNAILETAKRYDKSVSSAYRGAGVTSGQVWAWKHGRGTPTMETITKVRSFLDNPTFPGPTRRERAYSRRQKRHLRIISSGVVRVQEDSTESDANESTNSKVELLKSMIHLVEKRKVSKETKQKMIGYLAQSLLLSHE